jgi:hypothetical protein
MSDRWCRWLLLGLVAWLALTLVVTAVVALTLH